ncbi:MAG: tRNA (adenosine(37)-N6)-dimethylallyltransferase MiaA [Clostridia bacterium]|nr:tRNA (adenosine(37)-N6)-dimethylallyltransferase MiaA [Clostridia bacterium]
MSDFVFGWGEVVSTLKKPLLVIAGPTASGKTALAIALCKALNGEVVSADSMQVYEGIPVATACPTMEEREGVVHHMLSCVPLSASYSVAQYARQAQNVIEDIHARGKLPVLCGGTGLYIAALTDNVRYEEQDDERAKEIRERLRKEHAAEGDEAMWERLRTIDPALAAKLHVHDRGRVLRGLEVFELSGVTMSELQRRQKSEPSMYDVTMIVLDFRDREKLYDRIDRRVTVMLQNGLLEETAAVVRLNSPTADQAIGCKELRPYFNGECTLYEALACMRRRSRQYAKRQLSWFRRISTATTLYVDDYETPQELVQAALEIAQ